MNSADKVWKIADVMVEDVVTVAPNEPYHRLVEQLWIHGISGLPVVDDAGSLVGMVSESDLLRHQGNRPELARDLMTTPVVTVQDSAGLGDAAATMLSRGLKRLPVVDAGGKLVGIVSRADLLKVFLRSEETLAWDVAEIVQRQLGLSSQVTFTIADAVVHLDGTVASREQADSLTAAVRRLAGVVAVEDRLKAPVPAI
ncbi:MAG TPA: CBS domain-containing protein [Candidatus Dormibacteraeota bacterium]|nr:CBS domain-containing protein [Candidatus Dormibacteraeota bacterium]